MILAKDESHLPLRTLLVASGLSAGLVAFRALVSGDWRCCYLIWNLLLAWMPLLFALRVRRLDRAESGRRWEFRGAAVGWLIFFPNAPYIFTDLIHLSSRYRGHFWTELVLILLCAWTGLLVGFVSLYLMHGVVARRLGKLGGWVFIAWIAGLSGCGIYLGRVLRWNSWDVLVRPLRVSHGVLNWISNPFANQGAIKFCALFATFLFVTYFTLYALTCLRAIEPAKEDGGKSLR